MRKGGRAGFNSVKILRCEKTGFSHFLVVHCFDTNYYHVLLMNVRKWFGKYCKGTASRVTLYENSADA